MEENKKSNEVLAEIYRNTQLSLASISDIMPEIDDERIKEEIRYQHEEYEKISSKASLLAKTKNIELKEPNPIKKAMMWSGVKMNTLADNSVQNIAEMMIRGTVMGITALRQSETDNKGLEDKEITDLLHELISLEESFEKRLKEFL